MITKPHLIILPKIEGKSGYLSFLDEDNHLPISIKRLYWIFDAEEGADRGNHAHLNSDRVIVCLQGKATISIESTEGNRYDFTLDDPSKVLYFPRLHWLNLKLSEKAIFLAASSCNFKEDVVIKDYKEFKSHGVKQI
jgi:hypothetical protein